MNGPRLALNATLAGLYGALLLAAALRVLHPDASFASFCLGMLPVVAIYALAAGVVWPLLYGLLRFFASRRLRVPALSPRYILSFHVANTAVLLVSIGWLMVTSRRGIDLMPAARLRFLLGAVAAAWVYGAVVAIVPAFKRNPYLLASAAGLALAALSAPLLVLPGAPPAGPETAGAAPLPLRPTGRLVLVAVDGADLEDLLTLMARGRLPQFARLRKEGTYGRLQAPTPGDTAVARTLLATGQFPAKNGVRGAYRRDIAGEALGLMVVPQGIGFDWLLAPVMTRRPASIDDRIVPALWDIVGAAGGVAITSGWEVDLDTAPPPPRAPSARRRAIASEFMEGDAGAAEDPALAELFADVARALDADAAPARALADAATRPGGGIVAVAFPGFDRLAHWWIRAARPEAFGDVGEAEQERFGGSLAAAYARIDALVESARRAAGPDGWLFVVSSHGMEPAPIGRRLLELGSGPPVAGDHADAPAGFLFAAGPEIRPGGVLAHMSIAEVAPTVLHLLGMPIARDFDGSILDQAIVEGGQLDRPAVVIETYGGRGGGGAPAAPVEPSAVVAPAH